MKNNYDADSRRKQRHEAKTLEIGETNPCCYECGDDNIQVLKVPRNDPSQTSVMCRNCIASYESPEKLIRRQRKLLGSGHSPLCYLCGVDDLRLLELHHIAGRANGEFAVPLCLNCHAIQSDFQEDFRDGLPRQDLSS
jgi:hypothetical protein